MSSTSRVTRRHTFEVFFAFLGLPLLPSMLPRCCEPERISAAAENSSCLTAISDVGVHHKVDSPLVPQLPRLFTAHTALLRDGRMHARLRLRLPPPPSNPFVCTVACWQSGASLGRGCQPKKLPLVHKVEPWRSDPKMVLAAQGMLRRVSMETASQKGQLESSTVYRLTRAFRYYEDDPLVLEALHPSPSTT